MWIFCSHYFVTASFYPTLLLPPSLWNIREMHVFQNGVINFGTPPGLRSLLESQLGVLLASRLSAHQQAEQYVVPVHVLVIQPDVLTWLLSYPLLVLQTTYTISCRTFLFSVGHWVLYAHRGTVRYTLRRCPAIPTLEMYTIG